MMGGGGDLRKSVEEAELAGLEVVRDRRRSGEE